MTVWDIIENYINKNVSENGLTLYGSVRGEEGENGNKIPRHKTLLMCADFFVLFIWCV